ncbi:MAG TPA: restriction endonuclease subunit S, partial [Marinilabiliaceae bacterium]|nr:restriction endonuclease subunit S [Marinilabiliaceae bacterium]
MKEDWVECELGEVCFTTSGGTPSRQNDSFYEGNIPWVKSGELDRGVILDTEEHISEEAIKNSSAKIFPKGTLLFALYGATIGKMATLGVPAATNQAICAIYKNDILESKYLYNYLSFSKRDLINKGKGGAQPNISQTILKQFEIPIAPLPIQRAIVAKIEELFSSLESGIADLKKAQDQLVIYRQAVLKKAFEGELTKEWREKQTDLPTADELLEQIKVERQKHYEQQIKDWKVAVKEWEKLNGNGRKPLKPQSIKKFKEVSSDENFALPDLPTNWCWQKFGNVCLKIMDGTHFSPKNLPAGEYKYITAKNIKEGRIDLTKISFVSKADHQEIYARCDVKKGDVLYIKDGATTG